MKDAVWWIWLQHGLGAGASKQRRILESYASIEDFYRAGPEGWRLEGYLTIREMQRLERFSLEQAQAQAEYAQKLGQRLLTPDMPVYPQCLRELHNYPCVLYVKGTLPPVDWMLSVAVVGTRRATRSGKAAAHMLGYELAKAGAVVVSGGALGIDTQAHRGAVEAGGRSVCVLGCGLDADYLMTNADLREAVAVNGALLTEYPPGTQAMASNFPIRNRIISGLCDATVVVEAASKSGSLLTANDALEQGRDVFAVPGSIQNPFSKGTNALIQEGCPPVTSAADILCVYAEKYRICQPKESQANVQYLAQKITSVAEPPQPQPVSAPPQKPQGLSNAAEILLGFLQPEPIAIDTLCVRANLQPGALLAAATELELRGLARACAGQRYQLVQRTAHKKDNGN